jgi:hypothetical protein
MGRYQIEDVFGVEFDVFGVEPWDDRWVKRLFGGCHCTLNKGYTRVR